MSNMLQPFQGNVTMIRINCEGDTVMCPGRVVDILEASGAFDLGSNPSRGVSSSHDKVGHTEYFTLRTHR